LLVNIIGSTAELKRCLKKLLWFLNLFFFLGIFLFYLVHGSQNMSNNKNNSSLYAISRLKPIFAVANASQIFLMLLLFVIQLKSNQMLKINWIILNRLNCLSSLFSVCSQLKSKNYECIYHFLFSSSHCIYFF